MSEAPRVLAFAGSARAESLNKKLVRIACHGVESAGVDCTLVDLRDHPLPLFDADLEAAEGLPAAAARLRDLFTGHQGLLIASPEYNSSISPLLKNTIDWVSRSPQATQDLSGFQGKVAALLAASPGPLGGLRGLTVLRSLLGNVGVTVLPGQLTLRNAAGAFGSGGELLEERQAERARGLGRELADLLLKLHGGHESRPQGRIRSPSQRPGG